MSIGLWRMRLRSICFLFDFFLLILCWVDERNCWVKLSEAFVSYFWEISVVYRLSANF